MNAEQKKKFARFLSDDCENLLIENLESVEIASAEADRDGDKPVKAKVSVKFEWEAGNPSPSVKTVLSYTTSHKDETERTFNSEQAEIEFEGGAQ